MIVEEKKESKSPAFPITQRSMSKRKLCELKKETARCHGAQNENLCDETSDAHSSTDRIMRRSTITSTTTSLSKSPPDSAMRKCISAKVLMVDRDRSVITPHHGKTNSKNQNPKNSSVSLPSLRDDSSAIASSGSERTLLTLPFTSRRYSASESFTLTKPAPEEFTNYTENDAKKTIIEDSHTFSKKTITPSISDTDSTGSIPKSSSVELPVFSLNRSQTSETSFIDLITRNTPTSNRSNATFAFVQRSGKESLEESLHQIERIIKKEKKAKFDTNTWPPKEGSVEAEKSSKRANTIYLDFVGLYGYAQDEYYQIILGRASAIQIAIEAMQTFHYDHLIQASGCLFIGTMCNKSRMNGLKLVESGGLREIIDSVKKFPETPYVCSMAVNCLEKVTKATDLSVLFLKQMHGAVDVLESIPESVLIFESPDNRNTILQRIARVSATS